MNDTQDKRYPIPSIIAALIVAMAPHIGRLPPWIVIWCASMWGYMLLSVRFRWPRPNRFWQLILTIVGIAGLLATYRARLGPDSYLGLLAVMAAIKPFEITTHRHCMITIFVAYFIVITSLFQTETLLMALYMILSILVTTAALIRVNAPHSGLKADLKLAGLIVAEALPLMVILFLLFPRIPGSVLSWSRWHAATSGFSDTLRPGGISQILQDPGVAFRAAFDADMPAADQLYWRGVVFDRFDGRQWQRAHGAPLRQSASLAPTDDTARYTITLEPHRHRWLFALDRPLSAPAGATLDDNYILSNRRPVRRRMQYRMDSAILQAGSIGQIGAPATDAFLSISGNPETRRLAEKLGQPHATASEKAQQVLQYFKTYAFVYTLAPPVLGADPIDSFLFETRRGYCEHFATAMAFLMRAMHVPARIVGGYLGGEFNPYGNYLIVKQSDAHVWVEIWQRHTGWIRIDPTAAVEPDRVAQALSNVLAAGQTRMGGLTAWAHRLRLGWDNLSSQWEAWFSGYAFQQQQALLARLGISATGVGQAAKALGLMAGLLCLSVAALLVWHLRGAHVKPDRIQALYHRFCNRLLHAGLPARHPGMGPRDYANQTTAWRPDLKNEITAIIDLYIRLRYGKKNDADPEVFKQFQMRINAFKPKPLK